MKGKFETEARWRKADLHSHCSADPFDYRICGYTPEQLVAEAARLGYEILAITCHDLDIWTRDLAEYADGLGITLIPGMEVTVEGCRHVLAYNFQTGCENLNRLEKIRARRREDTLVIAPHVYYPARSCLRHLLKSNLQVFDALEVSGFYTAHLDFNARTTRIAKEYNKPLVGNGDIHSLWQLDRTFTWIYSEAGLLSVLDAVKRGRVRVESSPLSASEVVRWWGSALWHYVFPLNSRPSKGALRPIYD